MQIAISKWRENYGAGARGILLIFVEDEGRPGTHGDLLGDFAWRRMVDYKQIAKDKSFQQAITDALNETTDNHYTIDDLLFKFDRKAGCRMCPCSPGIVVKDKVNKDNNVKHCPSCCVTISGFSTTVGENN